MEVHRQTCQECGSRKHNNIVVREPGHRPTVFVRCAECASLVARYGLADYYHHGKGLESYLRSVQGAAESGRRMLEEFEATQHEAVEGFARALDYLNQYDKKL
jgi:RNase P subunit RPR2